MPKLIKPTLVIGLGSTGCRIVLALLRRLKREAARLPTCQFLLLNDAPLETLQAASEAPSEHKIAVQFIRLRNEPVSTRAEAHHIIAAHAETLNRSVADAFADMTAVQNRDAMRNLGYQIDTRNADFYVFASLGGCLGSGGLLDVVYLVRDFMQRRRVNHLFKGFLILPDAYAEGDVVLREAQAYAALRELDFVTERGQFSFTYSDRISVRVNERPFDQTYLLDATNEEGLHLDFADFCQVVGEMGYRILTTGIGEALDLALEPLSVPPRYLDGKLGAYSSLGYSALTFPARTLADFCAARLGTELGARILHPPANDDEIIRHQRDFVNRLYLGQDQGSDVLGAITRSVRGLEEFEEEPPPSFADVPEEGLVDAIDAYFKDQGSRGAEGSEAKKPEQPEAVIDSVEQEVQQLKEKAKKRAGRKNADLPPPPPSLRDIDRQVADLTTGAVAALRDRVRALLDDPLNAGIHGTRAFLSHLGQRAQQIQEQVQQQSQNLQASLPALRQQLQERRQSLVRAIVTAPSPAVSLLRTGLLGFLLVYGIGAGLDYLYREALLNSPPLLQEMFRHPDTSVQNVMLASTFLLLFVLHGSLQAERQRSFIARCRREYVDLKQEVRATELKAKTAQAAAYFLSRILRKINDLQGDLEIYRSKLEQARTALAQKMEERGAALTVHHCVSEEGIAAASDFENLYQEQVAPVTAELNSLMQETDPLHVWARWSAEKIAQTLHRFAQSRFERLRHLSVEDIIHRQAQEVSPLARLEWLYSLGSPFLRYSDVHLRGSGAVLPVDVVGLADPQHSSLVRLAENLRSSTVVAATGDAESICVVRTKNALPLYSLAAVASYRDRYERMVAGGLSDLHSRPEYEHLPDPMPDSLIELDPELHRSLAVGLAFDLVASREAPPSSGRFAFFLTPSSAEARDQILLGYDTRECIDYLRAHPSIASRLHTAIHQHVTALTPLQAAAHLEERFSDERLSEKARARLREYVELLRSGQELDSPSSP